MSEKTLLEQAVAALPEIYQPIYGHADSWPASRKTDDRLHLILPVMEKLSSFLGRPPRVLDIGCAQGYLSLKLAETGAEVIGIDNEPENIEVCRLLAEENPNLNAVFEKCEAIDYLQAMPEGRFDIVIGLSVLHHICYRIGLAATKSLIKGVAARSKVGIFEFAGKSEPLYWAAALPDDPFEFVEDYRFARAIGTFPTHLSEVPRPMLFCSNTQAMFGEMLFSIDSIRGQSIFGLPDNGLHVQYYIESGENFIKYVSRRCPNWAAKREETAREASYLQDGSRAADGITLFEHVENDEELWLRQSRISGTPLDLIKFNGGSVDALKVVRSVLEQLVQLEARGWYHSDIAIWNVMITPEGGARLVDFGALRREPVNCTWPGDIRLAFCQFIFDMTSDLPVRVWPWRRPRIRPSMLPEPFQAAMTAFLARNTTWSAKALLDIFDSKDHSWEAVEREPEIDIATAIDDHLDRLGDTVEILRQGYLQQSEHLNSNARWRSEFEQAHHMTHESLEALRQRVAGLEQAHHLTHESLEALRQRVAGLEQAHHMTRQMVEQVSRHCERLEAGRVSVRIAALWQRAKAWLLRTFRSER